jgi:hypothetical protein
VLLILFLFSKLLVLFLIDKQPREQLARTGSDPSSLTDAARRSALIVSFETSVVVSSDIADRYKKHRLHSVIGNGSAAYVRRLCTRARALRRGCGGNWLLNRLKRKGKKREPIEEESSADGPEYCTVRVSAVGSLESHEQDQSISVSKLWAPLCRQAASGD